MMDARALVDDALEITIVGSFSRLGYEVRRRLFDWQEPAPGALGGRTVLVTGPTSGLGRAAADRLADLGARVILVGRHAERLASTARELERRHGDGTRFPTVLADMSSLASVRDAVARIDASEARLDVLVDSAGAIYPTRRATAEGLEATFATMVVGPFVLIAGLLPLLRASGDGRVVSVVSGGMYGQALPLEDLQFDRGTFDGTLAYARAKRASTALVREWARRLRGGTVRVDAMHPGWADTPGLAESLPGFHRLMGPLLRTPEQGIDTVLWLATRPPTRRPAGRLYLDRRERPFDRLPSTRLTAADRRWLWDEVVRLADIADPAPDPARMGESGWVA